jgi:hypothetical protein
VRRLSFLSRPKVQYVRVVCGLDSFLVGDDVGVHAMDSILALCVVVVIK